MREIETERLLLRQFTMDDLDDLYFIYSHPDLSKYLSNEQPLRLDQTRAAINSIIESWQQHKFGVWAVVYKKHRKLIGHCGLKFLENTPEVQIGYLLLKDYWRRGFGTEAAAAVLKYGFDVVKLERIVAIAKPENIASRRVMEKVGMKYEKDAYFYENDVVYYSLSRQGYQLEALQLRDLGQYEELTLPIPQPLAPVLG
ncbi:GNAT family N-acetyltransferase [Microcoleus sp. FACHB-SPT15]|uniref:GNAT family N-acetyltransferase n=1 Tax=Microcoleus sp. FACHB-SPT15 TaxID=2692830 RepID=UPI0017819610|nr:GNAT family N-acetyltransferase [Microcoleus sp. FACHB-SPT15]MBD1807247.1 GNAT family N-acetyltransferase [Microcoleus sp. FACHB-SPT15]